MESKQDIIISQSWGGLGDNLAFSTLPELYSKLGYNVYISNANHYRNNEIYDLVWKLNPYIKGISSLPPNAGQCRGLTYPTANPMKNMALQHGLTNNTFNYPILYYKPKFIPELEHCLLYDITSISSTYTNETIKSSFNVIFDKYPSLEKRKIEFAKIPNRTDPSFGHTVYTIQSLFDYCDAIFSCKVHLSVMSGSCCLAAAIKQDKEFPEVYVVHNHTNVKPGYMYFFDNLTFIYTPN